MSQEAENTPREVMFGSEMFADFPSAVLGGINPTPLPRGHRSESDDEGFFSDDSTRDLFMVHSVPSVPSYRRRRSMAEKKMEIKMPIIKQSTEHAILEELETRVGLKKKETKDMAERRKSLDKLMAKKYRSLEGEKEKIAADYLAAQLVVVSTAEEEIETSLIKLHDKMKDSKLQLKRESARAEAEVNYFGDQKKTELLRLVRQVDKARRNILKTQIETQKLLRVPKKCTKGQKQRAKQSLENYLERMSSKLTLDLTIPSVDLEGLPTVKLTCSPAKKRVMMESLQERQAKWDAAQKARVKRLSYLTRSGLRFARKFAGNSKKCSFPGNTGNTGNNEVVCSGRGLFVIERDFKPTESVKFQVEVVKSPSSEPSQNLWWFGVLMNRVTEVDLAEQREQYPPMHSLGLMGDCGWVHDGREVVSTALEHRMDDKKRIDFELSKADENGERTLHVHMDRTGDYTKKKKQVFKGYFSEFCCIALLNYQLDGHYRIWTKKEAKLELKRIGDYNKAVQTQHIGRPY